MATVSKKLPKKFIDSPFENTKAKFELIPKEKGSATFLNPYFTIYGGKLGKTKEKQQDSMSMVLTLKGVKDLVATGQEIIKQIEEHLANLPNKS